MGVSNDIYVTSPLLPPLSEFYPYLEQIWENKQLTNNGPFHRQLELSLASYLGCQHISLFSNGTLALLCAIRALGITGEVITTPYSFVATSHSLSWSGLKPIFVDIDPITGNLDPDKIEQAITPQTTAILPVHCYGIPADVDKIDALARKHGLKVIYDAAHAFGVTCDGNSILQQGDLSILSFHATKVFNTVEGGAIICPDLETKRHIDRLKNFGFSSETTVDAIGINAKMNELQAAFGMLQLKHIDHALLQRKACYQRYRQAFAHLGGVKIIQPDAHVSWNYAYFPLFIGADLNCSRDELYAALKNQGIMARRYFFPLISDFPVYSGLASANPDNLPVARRLANQVLCLPIYAGLAAEDQQRVINVVLNVAAKLRSDSVKQRVTV